MKMTRAAEQACLQEFAELMDAHGDRIKLVAIARESADQRFLSPPGWIVTVEFQSGANGRFAGIKAIGPTPLDALGTAARRCMRELSHHERA